MVIKIVAKSAFILLAVAVPTKPSWAIGPSFDCDRAKAPIETVICANRRLSDLDLRLEEAFRAALKRDPTGKAALLQDQRDWLARRASDCKIQAGPPTTGVACVERLYRERATRLEAVAPPTTSAFCEAVADTIRRADGYPKAGKWTSLVASLTQDPRSPVGFALTSEPMTPKIRQSLPATENDQSLADGEIFRFGPSHALFAIRLVQGTMHCASMTFYADAPGGVKALAGISDVDESEFCGTELSVGDTKTGVPVFASDDEIVGRQTLGLTLRENGAWRPACTITADYATRLTTIDRGCASASACSGLEAAAIIVAQAVDAAGNTNDPPEAAGSLTRIAKGTFKNQDDDDLPPFGQYAKEAYTTFEHEAPVYAARDPSDPVVYKISHGTMGWRTSDGYIVGVYKKVGKTLLPIASFVIDKTRAALREITVKQAP